MRHGKRVNKITELALQNPSGRFRLPQPKGQGCQSITRLLVQNRPVVSVSIMMIGWSVQLMISSAWAGKSMGFKARAMTGIGRIGSEGSLRCWSSQ